MTAAEIVRDPKMKGNNHKMFLATIFVIKRTNHRPLKRQQSEGEQQSWYFERLKCFQAIGCPGGR